MLGRSGPAFLTSPPATRLLPPWHSGHKGRGQGLAWALRARAFPADLTPTRPSLLHAPHAAAWEPEPGT